MLLERVDTIMMGKPRGLAAHAEPGGRASRASWSRLAPLLAWCALVFAGALVDSAGSGAFSGAGLVFIVLAGLIAATRLSVRGVAISPPTLVFAWTLAATAGAFTIGEAPLNLVWFAAPILAAGVFGRAPLTAEACGLASVGLVGVLLMGMFGLNGAGLTGPAPAWAAIFATAPCLAWLSVSALSERDHLDRSGRARAAQLRDALNAMPGLALRVSVDGRVQEAHGALAQFGLTDPSSLSLDSVLDGPDAAHLRRLVAECAVGGAGGQGVSRAFGRPVVYALKSASAGRAWLVLRDASQETADHERIAAERDEATGRLRQRSLYFAGLGHELRTPLNAVVGFSDVMRQRLYGPLNARYAEYADLIFESAEHLLDLIGDVLDVSKIEAGRYVLDLSTFDARDVVSASARLIAEKAQSKGVALHLDLGMGPVPVEADERALKQILLNLLSNAVKFTPRGGRVTVRTRRERADLILEVVDTGPGIPAEDLLRLGRPFEQTESGRQNTERSSGLGLMVVRSLTELHGGVFAPESTLGAGATMRVRMPVVRASSSDPAERFDARARLKEVRRATRNGGGEDA